jgi:hypothetical protein
MLLSIWSGLWTNKQKRKVSRRKYKLKQAKT